MGSQRHLQQQDIGGMLADLARRVRDLERRPTLRNTSMTSGTTTIRDDNDVTRVRLGLTADGGSDYGLVIFNESSEVVYETGAAGVAYPRQALQVYKAGDVKTITSGTWDQAWTMVTAYAVADAVQVQVAVATPVGTTAEARLTCPSISGSPSTAVHTVPSGTTAYYEWKWAPAGLEVGVGPITFMLEVQRTGGTGDVAVYPPVQAYGAVAGSIAASATGV
jgi:hypothetical protein